MRRHTPSRSTPQFIGRRRQRDGFAHRRSDMPNSRYRRDRRVRAGAQRSVPGHKAADPITLAAATWLACGIVLLGLTPLPLRDATLGWSLAFWLLAAPSLLLLAKRAIRHP